MSEQRKWQRRAYDIWTNGDDGVIRPNFTTVVTPGGGKTRFAGDCAKFALDMEIVQQVIVVVPTRSIRRSFAKALAEHQGVILDRLTNRHLQLVARHAGGPNPFGKDAHEKEIRGCVVTYQQVGLHPLLFRRLMRTPTLVILDEIHHAGEDRSWGEALQSAFSEAKHRLMLSGTPWRSDENKLPFLSYEIDEDERGVPKYRVGADYSYTYAEALSDNVVRPVAFPTLDGECEWFSKSGEEMTANLKEEIEAEFVSERLRTFLTSEDSMREMLRSANDQLTYLRTHGGHRDAAGLIIANSIQHAQFLAGLLREVSRTDPIVATSDETEKALQDIDEFRRSSRPWIVAVRMISEGTDIPRLRVLVYANSVKTRLFFRQACGRVVRHIESLKVDQQAYVYIPADITLIRYAEEFRKDVFAWAKLRDALALERAAASSVGSPSAFIAIAATAFEDLVLEDDFKFQPPWLAVIREEIKKLNISTEISAEQMAKFYTNMKNRDLGGDVVQDSWVGDIPRKRDFRLKANDTPEDQREKLRKQITALVGQLARRFGIPHEEVRRDLMRRHGPIDFLTPEELRRQADMIKLWLLEGKYGGG